MGKTTLFLNGEILTANPKDELCDAMLIEEEKIVFVGQQEDALSLADADTEMIDLDKRAVIPGFINTAPSYYFVESQDVEALERRALEIRMLGWTTLRLSQTALGTLRHLVAEGELTSFRAPQLFLFYERAELLAERCRISHFAGKTLEDEAAGRQLEWAISDRRPISLESDGAESVTDLLSFFASLRLQSRSGMRNRIYLREPLPEKYLPLLFLRRLIPIFLGNGSACAESVLALREAGIPAVLACEECISPLAMMSSLLTAVDADYRSVPPLLSALSRHAAELESVGEEVGSLEWGKKADFLILSSPLIGCAPNRLSELKIAESWIGGERLFKPC